MSILEETATIMQRIRRYNHKRDGEKMKKDWYEIGRRLIAEGEKLKMHNETKKGARRTYIFYEVDSGNWEGPSARQFSKMNAERFEQELARRVSSMEWNLALDELLNQGGEGMLGQEMLTILNTTNEHESFEGNEGQGPRYTSYKTPSQSN